ncbi:MAG TPA: imidazoleglycerol-phosphate dehydratase HisB [Geminicoccus sp.]|mgnify:CR=1 FL=1|uniref:imidazoleglycerol-phosphate dehydratase HisB n=1 Tax=Geminicoccus sp. TaxID=2024832 RepID=UPI002CC79AD1|nr:imidazoleglycerol-phosphate dehydratase HisB [Geminicoccus sp.]HWL68084.1 imidazoleglycerol-phosphate dehydratase HisB [Geminicoccus sp.]
MTEPRIVTVERATSETEIRLTLNLDGSGQVALQTGIGFLDHMLTALARHGRLDLDLQVTGDLDVDDHHTVEDTGLALGSAIDQALSDRRGIERFAHAYAPLDEALARVVVDLSGRPFARVDIPFVREVIGDVATENLTHFFQSLAMTGRMALHVDVLHGDNDHHKAEAAFKALAIALRRAVARTGSAEIPSTKGSL